MRTVLFDLGGVVLGWDPRRAYAQVLDPAAVEEFMTRIDFPAWNHDHDAGRPFAEGERRLIEAFPEDEAAVLAYRRHFAHTLTGMVPGTAAVIAELGRAGVGLAALTNWSAETFPYASRRFGILRRFAGIVVSGTEGLAKPDPEVFALATRRFDLDPAETVFVDDSPPNVAAAHSAGMTALPFTDAVRLRQDLVDLGLLGPADPVTEPLFHLADADAWAQAQRSGRYPWSTRGVGYEAEGFVHCSFVHQLPGVLARHYAGVPADDLVVLELDPARLSGRVVVEDLGAGAYPHLYAELGPGEVTRVLPAGPYRG